MLINDVRIIMEYTIKYEFMIVNNLIKPNSIFSHVQLLHARHMIMTCIIVALAR